MKTQGKAIVDKLLTDVSNQLIPTGYISEMILALKSVVQWSGKVGKYGNEHLRIVNTLTTGKGKYAMVDSVVRSSNTYQLENHALKDIITEEDLDNVEKPFDAEEDTTVALSTHLWLGKEKSLADTLTDTTIITQNETLSGTDQFSDYVNSDPLKKLKDARIAVRGGCGFMPNNAAMDSDVAETLKFHPQLLDKLGFKEDRPGGLNDQELAKALNVKRVLIAEAVFNDSVLGQTDSIVPVWGKHLVFFFQPPDSSLKSQPHRRLRQ